MKTFLIVLTTLFSMIFAVPSFALTGIGNKGPQSKEYVYDFAVDGGGTGAHILSGGGLPQGAIVTAIHYKMVTAFTSSGSATVSVGDVGSTARYKALTAFDDAAFALNNIAALSTAIPNEITSANEGSFSINVAVAAVTAGKMKILVSFMVPKQ